MPRKPDRVLRRAPKQVIPSSFIIRALMLQGKRYECDNCGETMFVRYGSGLCPQCYNGRRPMKDAEEPVEVPDHIALAGVLDDPIYEFEQ